MTCSLLSASLHPMMKMDDRKPSAMVCGVCRARKFKGSCTSSTDAKVCRDQKAGGDFAGIGEREEGLQT